MTSSPNPVSAAASGRGLTAGSTVATPRTMATSSAALRPGRPAAGDGGGRAGGREQS